MTAVNAFQERVRELQLVALSLPGTVVAVPMRIPLVLAAKVSGVRSSDSVIASVTEPTFEERGIDSRSAAVSMGPGGEASRSRQPGEWTQGCPADCSNFKTTADVVDIKKLLTKRRATDGSKSPGDLSNEPEVLSDFHYRPPIRLALG